MITYVLTVSRYFPANHKRKGENTGFISSILLNGVEFDKRHTIRSNYDLWEKRFKKIDAGKAVLSLRYWEGQPYKSKQVEFLKLNKDCGIGLQKLEATLLGWFIDDIECDFTIKDFAKNDGLSQDDFKEWFNNSFTLHEPKAIIHFTNFRYVTNKSTNRLQKTNIATT
jgi:hypothetical protein